MLGCMRNSMEKAMVVFACMPSSKSKAQSSGMSLPAGMVGMASLRSRRKKEL